MNRHKAHPDIGKMARFPPTPWSSSDALALLRQSADQATGGVHWFDLCGAQALKV